MESTSLVGVKPTLSRKLVIKRIHNTRKDFGESKRGTNEG